MQTTTVGMFSGLTEADYVTIPASHLRNGMITTCGEVANLRRHNPDRPDEAVIWTDGLGRTTGRPLDGFVSVLRRNLHDLDPDCVGNSHALIVRDYGPTEALCECGQALTATPLPYRPWVHYNGASECPPCDCGCGQRHGTEREAGVR